MAGCITGGVLAAPAGPQAAALVSSISFSVGVEGIWKGVYMCANGI